MQRIDSVLDYIEENKQVTLDKLCEHFAVSKNTIRRDIDELAQRGVIRKIYGGVCFQESTQLSPFAERDSRAHDIKVKLAEAAAQFVVDGDSIFVDSGTTTHHMIKFLGDRRNVTVLTNNLDFIVAAINMPHLNIISLSGNLNRTTLSFTGDSPSRVLSSYNISKAFMASTGITIEKGVTNYYAEEYGIKKTAMQQSQQKFLLVDHFKIGVISFQTYGTLQEFDYLLTDGPVPENYADYMSGHGRNIHLVKC